jgi:hypothetical protein
MINDPLEDDLWLCTTPDRLQNNTLRKELARNDLKRIVRVVHVGRTEHDIGTFTQDVFFPRQMSGRERVEDGSIALERSAGRGVNRRRTRALQPNQLTCLLDAGRHFPISEAR